MAIKINNVENRMSGGGAETSPLDMKQFIKLADMEKIEADVLEDLTRELVKYV